MLYRPLIHNTPQWQPIYTFQLLVFISMSKGKAKIRNEAGFFCVWLAMSLLYKAGNTY